MHIRILNRYALFTVLAATLLGCNASPVLGGPTPASNSPATAPASDLCANPLLPVKLGATWSYRISDQQLGSAVFSTTITNVRPDGFTVATKFGDSVTANQEWACTPEGLLALSLASGQPGIGISLPGFTASLTTSNATGITLPAAVEPGMRWSYGLDIAGSFADGAIAVNVTGTLSSSEHAAGTETITVPGGTFNAMKIQSSTTLDVKADYHGIQLPVGSVVNSTFWFAPGVGWIKATQTGEFPGTIVNSTTELQSYTIP